MKISDEDSKKEKRHVDEESTGSEGSSLIRCQKKRRCDTYNAAAAAAADRISGLPECVRVHLLTFLPIKSAIQTCILSKSWINTWRFMGSIDFDIPLHDRKRVVSEVYVKFVDNVLRLHNHGSDILKVRYYHHDTIPDKFFAYLQTKNVQVVDMAADAGDFARLFTLSSLRELKIKPMWWFSTIVTLPTFIYLRSLQVLHFHSVHFEDAFHRLFSDSTCPTLKTLHIEECMFEYSKLRISFSTLQNLTLRGNQSSTRMVIISVPNLTVFDYNGPPIPIHFSNETVTLSKACLRTRYPTEELRSVHFYHLIRQVHHCESLSLSQYEGLVTNLLLQKMDLLDYIQIPFLNLKFLSITTSFYPGQSLLVNAILNNSPNLEILVLGRDEKDHSSLVKTKDEEWPWIECTMPCLKTVEIRKFKGCERGIMFVKFLLRQGLHLEKVCIGYDENDVKDGIGEYLETLPRVCSSVKSSTSTVLLLS